MHFMHMLRDGETILDIGANIGVMTIHLARAYPASRVFAFEPVPCNIRTLKRIVKHYKVNNVVLIEKALGNQPGQVNMVLPTEKKVRLHGLSHVMHSSITEYNEGQQFSVPMVTLDSITEWASLPRIGGIKMDVENYEYYVLDGGKELLKKHRPIVYTELWANENRALCFELMGSLGYSIQVLEHGALTSYNPTQHTHQNFFFTPNPL